MVRGNSTQNGPLRVRLQADSGWVGFNVAWKYSELEAQVFDNWYIHTLAKGSKSFIIKLKVAGGLLEHECYFNPDAEPPSPNQVGKRWFVSGAIIAISRAGLDECDGLSLINMFNAFEQPNLAIVQLDAAILELEALWLPH